MEVARWRGRAPHSTSPAVSLVPDHLRVTCSHVVLELFFVNGEGATGSSCQHTRCGVRLFHVELKGRFHKRFVLANELRPTAPGGPDTSSCPNLCFSVLVVLVSPEAQRAPVCSSKESAQKLDLPSWFWGFHVNQHLGQQLHNEPRAKGFYLRCFILLCFDALMKTPPSPES